MRSSMKRTRSDNGSPNSPRKEARRTRKVRISDEAPSEKTISPGAKEYNRENTITSTEHHKARLDRKFYPNEYILSKAEQELIKEGLMTTEEVLKYNEELEDNTESNSYQGIKNRKEIIEFMRLKELYQRLEEERNQLKKQLEEQEKKIQGGRKIYKRRKTNRKTNRK